MRETTVETHLRTQVVNAGGTTRKFSSATRKNNPDQIVIWPGAVIHFAELKAPKKTANAGQLREHTRLRKLGCTVVVLDTKAKVDAYVEFWR